MQDSKKYDSKVSCTSEVRAVPDIHAHDILNRLSPFLSCTEEHELEITYYDK